jgi:predicted lipoprotein with Yx(FWY)xxD motif
VEVAAFVVLAALALSPAPAGAAQAARPRFLAQLPPAIARAGGVTAAVLAVAGLALLGIAEAGATSAAPAAASTGTGPGAGLKTATIGGTRVLTNARGFTLYSFAPDTATASRCYGTCAAYWPPVTGAATAGTGLPGKTGTIQRTDGSRQLTYNGHPLYTYIGDSAPGQASGNNVNLNGGLWHEVPASR